MLFSNKEQNKNDRFALNKKDETVIVPRYHLYWYKYIYPLDTYNEGIRL